MNAEIAENVLRIRQHVHQMRDRRALIAADIADAGLQQRLGDGQNPFAVEDIPVAQFEVLDLAGERAFSHDAFPSAQATAADRSKC